MGSPYQYVCHSKLILKGEHPENPKLKCVNHDGKYDGCVICNAGHMPDRRWILPVWSNFQKKLYCLDMDYKSFSGIRILARDHIWGNPETYDINICVDKPWYYPEELNVIPYPKSDLTEEQSLCKSLLDKEELKRLTDPPSNEYLEKILAREYVEVKKLIDSDMCESSADL